jgi:hypothetical protein
MAWDQQKVKTERHELIRRLHFVERKSYDRIKNELHCGCTTITKAIRSAPAPSPVAAGEGEPVLV